MSFIYKEKLSDVPDEVKVYDLSKLDSSNDSLITFAQNLGLGGKSEEYCSSPEINSYREGQHMTEIDKRSGAILYRDLEKYGVQNYDDNKKWNVSDDRSQEIGRFFLKKLSIINENEIIFQKVTHLRGMTGSIDSDSREESIIDAGVIFGRMIDGIPVEGPGGSSMVNIDPNEKVVGFSHLMRPTKSVVDTVKIISPEIILNDIEKKFKEIDGKIIVKKARFGYFEFGKNDSQSKLQPVYAFIYEVQNDELSKKFITVVPAGQKTFESLEMGKRFQSTQIPRANKQ